LGGCGANRRRRRQGRRSTASRSVLRCSSSRRAQSRNGCWCRRRGRRHGRLRMRPSLRRGGGRLRRRRRRRGSVRSRRCGAGRRSRRGRQRRRWARRAVGGSGARGAVGGWRGGRGGALRRQLRHELHVGHARADHARDELVRVHGQRVGVDRLDEGSRGVLRGAGCPSAATRSHPSLPSARTTARPGAGPATAPSNALADPRRPRQVRRRANRPGCAAHAPRAAVGGPAQGSHGMELAR
jgi:hypothetical protein